MQIGNLAQPFVVSVGPNDSLDKAISLMEEHQIRHLPVIEAGRPLGMVSDRDLLIAVGWKLEVERSSGAKKKDVVGPRRVSEIMSSPALYLDPNATPAAAARMMAGGQFHALLIVRDATVTGLVTSTDLLRSFAVNSNPHFDEQVINRMRVNVRTIGPSAALFEAAELFKDIGAHHLPVVAGDEVLGILSDRDLRRACGEDSVSDELAERDGRMFIGATKVLDVMKHPVRTVAEDTSMREACQQMSTFHIGCLPVVRDEKLVGIMTDTDCLRFAAELEGMVDA